jgi:hypothetical protein
MGDVDVELLLSTGGGMGRVVLGPNKTKIYIKSDDCIGNRGLKGPEQSQYSDFTYRRAANVCQMSHWVTTPTNSWMSLPTHKYIAMISTRTCIKLLRCGLPGLWGCDTTCLRIDATSSGSFRVLQAAHNTSQGFISISTFAVMTCLFNDYLIQHPLSVTAG